MTNPSEENMAARMALQFARDWISGMWTQADGEHTLVCDSLDSRVAALNVIDEAVATLEKPDTQHSGELVDGELLPCPFCGGDAEVYNPHGDGDKFAVICKRCTCDTAHADSEEKVVVAWNSRTKQPPKENA